jgi:hypothetical protein
MGLETDFSHCVHKCVKESDTEAEIVPKRKRDTDAASEDERSRKRRKRPNSVASR